MLSFSRNFTAYHLLLSSEIDDGSTFLTSAIAASTSLEKISFGRSTVFFFATLIASSTTSSRPFPFNADVSTIGQFNNIERRSTSILIPRFSNKSAIFKAMTTGTPVSISCVVRYKFLSMFVASTKSMITSGFSFNKKSRLTTSSNVYGEREYIPGRSTIEIGSLSF